VIIRIVKMTFKPELVPVFLNIFEESAEKIRAFPGCLRLELLENADNPAVLFTYSYWNDVGDLESYRHSDLFNATWAKTKVLFDAKPEAWSLNRKFELG